MRTGLSRVPLLPTRDNTLLLEAGCASEKTRKLLSTWLKQALRDNPDMAVIFVTTRKTHADDLAATVKALVEGMGFVNYLDAKSSGLSKTAFLADARRLIVSEQSLSRVNTELYQGGVVIMDEVRSLASIPGDLTLPNPEREIQAVLRTLCTHAAYRVAMDADVSADGAVRDWLRVVAAHFDVLHVQLRQAALHRELHYGFKGSEKVVRDEKVMRCRLRLALFRARKSRVDAMAGEAGQRLRLAAQKVIGSLLRPARLSSEPSSAADRLKLPVRRSTKDARDAPVDWKPVSAGLIKREPERTHGPGYDRLAMACFWVAKADVSRQVERVFVGCASKAQAGGVVTEAVDIGARLALDEGFYKGKGSNDKVKREHFQDTSKPWLWADAVVATSTLSVGVNVRVHFACCFLYTTASAYTGKLRELFQGVVRVGRDAGDPLRDERIFMLIHGPTPSLDSVPMSQSRRHAAKLEERRLAAIASSKAAADAKQTADARLGIEGQEFNGAEAALDEPMLSLFAWRDLEMEDNEGERHVVKAMALCRIYTRNWEPKRMAGLSHAEKTELSAFELDRKARGESPRPLTADAAVSGMNTADRYNWLIGELRRAADADVAGSGAVASQFGEEEAQDAIAQTPEQRLAVQQGRFLADQEALLTQARGELDARGAVRQELYEVLTLLHPPGEYEQVSWPKDGEAFELLCVVIARVRQRALLSVVPRGELEVVHEMLRREGKTAHRDAVTPAHEMHGLLSAFAKVLDVPFASMLAGGEFNPGCHADADHLQSGACHPTCDGTCHEWLRCHNRWRAKSGSPPQQQKDEARRKEALRLAQLMGAKQPNGTALHGRSTLVTIFSAVLDSVLALTSPGADNGGGPGERKVVVAGRRCWQVTGPWLVGDAHAALADSMPLPMLRPEEKRLQYVRADQWAARFEELTSELPAPDPYAPLLSDDPMDSGEAGSSSGGGGTVAAGPSGGGGQRWGFDPRQKTFLVAKPRLDSMIETLERESPAVVAATSEIDARLNKLREDSQGAAGGAKSAFVLLVHPTEPKVLMAREERRGWSGDRWRGGVARLNPLGGKSDAFRGDTNLRDTVAREARELTAEKLSTTAYRSLLSGAGVTGAYDAATKAFVYAHRLTNPQDASLPAHVPARHQKHQQLLGLHWVPLDGLLDDAWCEQHCHAFCRSQIATARLLLQALVQPGGGSGGGASACDIGATAREMKELEALCKPLARHQSLLAVARAMAARCEGKPVDDRGYVTLSDTYSQRGTGGRRYVDAAYLPSTADEEGIWERRTATLQGGHKDLRPVCCGEFVHDADCENGDYRLIASRAEADGLAHLVPSVFDFVEHRGEYFKEICELHTGCTDDMAKRLPNVVGYDGDYYTWLRKYDLETPSDRLKAFDGKKCKTFLPEGMCRADEPNMARELHAMREACSEHPRYAAHVAAKRAELERRDGGPRRKHATSLWSNLVQTWENEVLCIKDETLFGLGWDTWWLEFDGLAAAPSPNGCAEPDFKAALAQAQAACRARGWKYVALDDKPLHGRQDETPKSIAKAREALKAWQIRKGGVAADQMDTD